MSLSYPLSVMTGDSVTFSPMPYRSNSGGSPPAAGGAQGITLYMPSNTPTVGNSQGWSGANFEGPLGALQRNTGKAITEGVMGIGQEGASISGIVESAKNKFNEGGGFANSGGALRQFGLSQIPKMLMGGTPNQMLALSRGQVYNPNVELIYSQPGFRTFVFNFDFVPKNASESNIMNQIILQFKKYSAPVDLGNGMFEVPHIWQVSYRSNGATNQFMNKFKPAACTNVTVVANSATDMHVSHVDGSPIQTTMSLSFQETDIITRKDQTGGQGY